MGLTYQNMEKYDEALEQFQTAHEVMSKRLENLKLRHEEVVGKSDAKGKSKMTEDMDALEKEIQDLEKDILPSIAEKIADLEEDVKATSGGMGSSSEASKPKTEEEEAQVNDLSNLIKKKTPHAVQLAIDAASKAADDLVAETQEVVVSSKPDDEELADAEAAKVALEMDAEKRGEKRKADESVEMKDEEKKVKVDA